MKNLKQLLPVTVAIVGLSILAGAWTGAQSPPTVSFSSDLVGMKVVSRDGDDLGKIEDIVVHPGGAPSYAVLSFGGWLGMGDKLFAMPWSVLRRVEADTAKKDSARSLVLPLDKERLKTAPGFDKKNWPSMANADWAKDVDAFYKGDANPNTKQPAEAAAKNSLITWRVSELLGLELETPTGESLGELEKVAIDSNGRVSYVAVDVADFVDIDGRMVAVPWDALKFSLGGDKGDEKKVTLASTEKQLELAPQFKDGKDHRVEMCDPKWIARVYEHYSVPSYTMPKGREVGSKQ